MASGIAGKGILVTGGTTGIGRAIAMRLAERGGKLFIFGRHEKELNDGLAAIKAKGEVAGMTADQAKHDDVVEVFEAARKRCGRLDVVIANAAIAAEGLADMKDKDWRYVADTNFSGYLDVAKQAIDAFGDDGGDLILVGSVSGDEPSEGESVYAATKAGIAGFAAALRKEVAEKKIRVSLIEPGAVGSDMQESSPAEQRKKIAKHEMLKAEDVADLVEFILQRPERCSITEVRIEPRIAN